MTRTRSFPGQLETGTKFQSEFISLLRGDPLRLTTVEAGL